MEIETFDFISCMVKCVCLVTQLSKYTQRVADLKLECTNAECELKRVTNDIKQVLKRQSVTILHHTISAVQYSMM